jgi:hypothetical protein
MNTDTKNTSARVKPFTYIGQLCASSGCIYTKDEFRNKFLHLDMGKHKSIICKNVLVYDAHRYALNVESDFWPTIDNCLGILDPNQKIAFCEEDLVLKQFRSNIHISHDSSISQNDSRYRVLIGEDADDMHELCRRLCILIDILEEELEIDAMIGESMRRLEDAKLVPMPDGKYISQKNNQELRDDLLSVMHRNEIRNYRSYENKILYKEEDVRIVFGIISYKDGTGNTITLRRRSNQNYVWQLEVSAVAHFREGSIYLF